MEDYRLEQSGQEVQDILNGAAMQTDLTAENERAELAEQTLQGNIDAEEERAKAAEKQNADDIDAIEEKIPSGASSQNKLVDQQTMNSSIATATATYRGAYNLVSDLDLTVSATEQQIAEALATKMAALSITPDNNDYCYVQVPTSDATPTQIARVDRYKFNGTAWGLEYSLNNSGFTAAQWAALNSGITSGLVTKLSDLPTYTELMTLFNGKQNTLTFDSTPTAGSNNPVTSNGIQQYIGTIEEKIPSGASSQNKLVDQQTMNSSIATATATYRGAYNLVSDLSLTISATEQQIAAALATKMTALSITPDNNDYCYVQVPTSDATPTQIARVDRYKFNGTSWGFEYALNNSGFTAEQWAALNSGITSGLVTKLSDLPTYTELMTLFNGKQNTLTFDSTPTAGSSNPVTSNGIKQAIDAHTVVTDATPTAGSTNPVQSGGVKTYVDNKTEAQDLVIANAIEAQNDEIDRRMDQQDAIISTLNGQDVIVVSSVPASGVANKIYRVYGTTSYSDYMFNADALTTPIKIAEYSYPGVDDEPTAGSDHLVKSGGVYKSFTDFLGETPEEAGMIGNPVSSEIYPGDAWDTNQGILIHNEPQTAALPGMTFIKIQSTKYRLFNFIFTQDIKTGTKNKNQRLVPELGNLAKIDISNGFEFNSYGKYTYLTIVTPDDSAITDTPEQISKDIIVTYLGSEPTPVPEGVGETLISGIRKTAIPYYFIHYAWDTIHGGLLGEADCAAFEVSAFSYNKIIVQSSVYKLFNFYCTEDKDGNLSKSYQIIDPTKGNSDVLDITDGVEIQGGEKICLTATTDGLTPLDENELKENVIITKVLYSVEDRLSVLENNSLLVPGPNGKKYQIYVADGDNGAEFKIMEA